MDHYQPNDRPIHPECGLLSKMAVCTCDYWWDYWDGTTTGLDRKIAWSDRLELRTQNARRFDLITELDEDETTGFWKLAEFLRTTVDR